MKTKFSGILTLLLAFVVQLSFAQEKTISGTVSDDSGLPLPGATVLVKGTSSGTSTDFDGNYSITANQGATLVFSFVGYTTKEANVGASSTINVTLQEDAEALEEVVVTAFGIKRNEKSLGYAVSKVDTEEIVENSEPDLIRSLAGKVPGVDVNFSNGTAGASNRIQIRGATSLGGGQPLIIVDGVAYDNTQVTTSSQTTGGGGYESGISSLDPNSIASVNVLKSTAAAALYGSRATNGVIVITTKGGTGNVGDTNRKLDININSGTYFENIANLPEYQNKYGNGVNYGYVNANGSWGPAFDTLDEIPTWPNLLNAFPGQFGPTVPYVAQPNNTKDLFRTGVVLDNSISASYGGEKGGFNVTLSDLQQEGYIPFNTYDRTSISLGGTFKLSNKFTVGGTMSYSNTDQVGAFLGNNQFAGSASSFARALWLGRTWDLSLPYTDPTTGASVTPNNGWDHPLWSWENDQIITETGRTVANYNMSYEFNDNISTSFRVGFNKYELKRRQIRNAVSRASLTDGGSLQFDNATNEDIESTLLVNFNYDLTEDIGFSAITGMNSIQNSFKRDTYNGSQFVIPGLYTLRNTINVASDFDLFRRKRNFGVFADLTFSYKDFLFLNATGRNDWSSTLPLDNRSYFYPSVSASVILTDAFNIDSNALTYAKIRGGFASVGRDADPEFLNATFAIGNAFNGVPVLSNRLDLGDQQITPEFTDELELGIDLEFFKRRIAVDFTWYKKITTDLIFPLSVSTAGGFDEFNTNVGEMQNTGIEIGLTLIPIRTDNFEWTSFTTFTSNENTVNSIVDGVDRVQLAPNQIAYAQVGQPFGVFYGTRFARDDDGNYLINEAGGGIIQDLQNGVIGDPNPDFKIGFINTFRYKNFSLRSQFDWREGGDIRSISITSLLGRGVTKDTEDRERTFVIPGFLGDGAGNPILDVNGDQIPNSTQIDMNELYFSPAGGNTFGINSTDEANVFDGTVFRLREISLSYDVPSKLLEKTPFGKVSFSVVGNNLWYFAPNVPKYTNFDPEVTSFGVGAVQGIENTTAPTAKRYGFKVNVSF